MKGQVLTSEESMWEKKQYVLLTWKQNKKMNDKQINVHKKKLPN